MPSTSKSHLADESVLASRATPVAGDPTLLLLTLAVGAAALLSPQVGVVLAAGLLLFKWPELLFAFAWCGMALVSALVPEGTGLFIGTALLVLISGVSVARRSDEGTPVPWLLAGGLTLSVGVVYLWATLTPPAAHAADRPAQLVAGALLLPATVLVVRSQAALTRYLWAFVVLGVVLAVGELLRLAGGGSVHEAEIAFGLNPINLGRSTMLATLAALWLLRRSPGLLVRLLLLAAFVVTCAGTIGTGSRAPMIGTVLGVLLVTLVSSTKARLAVVGVAVIGAGYLASTEGVRRLAETDSGEGNVSSRLEAWRAAMETFSSSPLTGAGVGRYWEGALTRVEPLDFPHNLPLEIAAELGGVAIVALVALLLAAWVRNQAEARALLVAAVTVVLFSGNIGTSQILWALIGLALAAKRLQPATSSDDDAALSAVAEPVKGSWRR